MAAAKRIGVTGEPVSSDVSLLANAEGVVMKWYACKDFAELPRPV